MRTDFQFGSYPNILLFIAIVAFWVIAKGLESREKQEILKILPEIVKKIRRKTNPSYSLPNLHFALITLIFIVIALMRPQWGFEMVKGVHEGVDIIIAADVSDSMLAEDVKPDRLNVERRKIEDLLEIIYGDRVALISFAGAAFIESPLTLDYKSLKIISKSLNTDLVPLKGSNFESIALSASSLFRKKDNNTHGRDRALIIFSDGEFEPESVSLGLDILKNSKIVPYLVLIGTTEGAPVPGIAGFKKDAEDKLIISKANFSELQQQFSNANGLLIRSTLQDSDLREIYLENIKKNLNQSKLDYNNVKKWNEYYQYPLTLGVLFLMILWWRRIMPSRSIYSLIILSMLFSLDTSILMAQDISKFQQGLKLYEDGKFNEALQKFNDLEEIPSIAYDKYMATGNTHYRLGNFQNALEEFGKAQSLAKSPKDRAKTLFNTANTLAQLGDLKKSLEVFEQAKKEAPKDKEIQSNIDYVNRLLKNLENKKTEENKQEQGKQNDQASEGNDSDENDVKSPTKSEQSSNDHSQNNQTQNHPPEKTPENDSQKNKDEKSLKDSDSNKSNPSEAEKNSDPDLESDGGRKEESEQTSAHEPTKGSDETAKADRGSKTDPLAQSEPLNDQLESQLGSIEENTNARNQYRYKKALEQMEREQRQFPLMDW